MIRKSIISLTLVVLFSQCTEEGTVALPSNCVEVSIVTAICGQAVLKIEDPRYYRYGERWKEHDNVFFTFFDCTVNELELKDKRFFVTLEAEPSNTNCAVCLAALEYNGKKKYFVDVHEVCATPLETE